jgi:hypothetical protein
MTSAAAPPNHQSCRRPRVGGTGGGVRIGDSGTGVPNRVTVPARKPDPDSGGAQGGTGVLFTADQ